MRREEGASGRSACRVLNFSKGGSVQSQVTPGPRGLVMMTLKFPKVGIKAMAVTGQSGLEAPITISLDYFLCSLVSCSYSRKSMHALEKHSVHIIPASST